MQPNRLKGSSIKIFACQDIFLLVKNKVKRRNKYTGTDDEWTPYFP